MSAPIRAHPETGRKGLFVSEALTTRINELGRRGIALATTVACSA